MTTSRRRFLGVLSGATLGAGIAGKTGAAPGAGTGRWLVSCRDAHLKEAGQSDCWAAAKWLGIDGIELGVDDKLACPGLGPAQTQYSVADAAGVERLRADLDRHKVAVPAFCMHNRFDERLEQELEWIARLVEVAPALGVRAIRIDVVPRKTPVDAFLDFAVGLGKRLCTIGGNRDVRFAIENHGKVTNDPAFLRRLFAAVGSDRLGLTLDPMNFYWFGHPLDEVYKIYEEFAPRAFHTHCKNLGYPPEKRNERRPIGWEYGQYARPVYEGDIDFRRVATLLRAAGYAGDLCLENETVRRMPEAERPAVLKREIAFLKGIVAG